MRSKLSDHKQRLRYLLWVMIQKHQPNCCICGEKFELQDILPSRGVDQLTEHHLDGDHMNFDLKNRELAHRKCHKSYHTKDNVNRR